MLSVLASVVASVVPEGNNFEFLWVAYRDYSDGPLLIQRNEWTSDADQLQRFVNGIVCSGGGDRDEAVERALLVARSEHDKVGAFLVDSCTVDS